jgi:hypothetical protein
MEFNVTGASADDLGPAGCVVRFILAGVAGDSESAARELHPDSLEAVSGGVHAPPGITAAAVGEVEPQEGCVHVPTMLTGPDGTEQRFVFVARPVEDRWGIDLEESMKATFGCDPMQMMEDALRSAVQPIGDALSAMGDAIGDAVGGGSPSGPAARRLATDEPMPATSAEAPGSVGAHVVEVELRRRAQRSEPGEEFAHSTELTVRCRLDLDPAWTAQSCTGVTLDAATSVEGEDLRPVDAGEDLGSENYASWERERREFTFRVPLAPPQGEFTGLAEFSGTVRLAAVGGELFEIVLGPVGELLGRAVPIAAFGVEVAFDRDGDGSLTVRAPSSWFDRLSELVPTAPDGSALNDSWSMSGDGETSTRVYGYEIPDDATLVARFWGCSETLSLPFAAEDLPVRLA